MGAIDRPFNLFLPDMDTDAGQTVVNLLETRYISSDDAHPRRSYEYVTGRLSVYRDRPQMVGRSVGQIREAVTFREDTTTPNLVAAVILPDPGGLTPVSKR